MKFYFAALALSYAVIRSSNASPIDTRTLKSSIAEPIVTKTTVVTTTSSSTNSSNSSCVLVGVSSIDDTDDVKNSPSLPVFEDEDDENDETETSSYDEVSGSEEININENYLSAARIVYPEKDLPVISQRESFEDKESPPVPQVTDCKTEGQIVINKTEGPSDATRIAREFNNAKIPIKFFVNTKWLVQQQYAMVLQNLYSAGHLIGMTYRLPNDDPGSMTDEEIKQDIIENSKMIEKLIHVAPKYVRLHFSAKNDGRTEQLLKEMGYVVVEYSLDGKDYTYTDPAQIANEYSHTFTNHKIAHDDKKEPFVAIQYDIPETAITDKYEILFPKKGFEKRYTNKNAILY